MLTQQNLDLTKTEKLVHECAVFNAASVRQAEAAVLQTVMNVDVLKLYRKFNLPSTYAYCMEILELTEPEACNYINVARKIREVPELHAAIESGDLKVAKARKIVPVLNKENQAEWISKAATLSYKALEREVAREKPQAARPDRIKHTGPGWMRLEANITEETWAKFAHVQDLISSASYDEVLSRVLSQYIEKHDPLKKAERAKSTNAQSMNAKVRHGRPAPESTAPESTASVKPAHGSPTQHTNSSQNEHLTQQHDTPTQHDRCARVTAQPSQRRDRTKIPKEVEHAVNLRDQRKCQNCKATRYLQFHHILEVAKGGADTAENLVTLCSSCHRAWHARA
jgi:5-methylcytosine-specific restriction endonuclease McrA